MMLLKMTIYDKLVKKVNDIQTNDTSKLVKKADYDTKIKEVEDKITINIVLLKNLISKLQKNCCKIKI